jgi:hypothetical protein
LAEAYLAAPVGTDQDGSGYGVHGKEMLKLALTGECRGPVRIENVVIGQGGNTIYFSEYETVGHALRITRRSLVDDSTSEERIQLPNAEAPRYAELIGIESDCLVLRTRSSNYSTDCFRYDASTQTFEKYVDYDPFQGFRVQGAASWVVHPDGTVTVPVSGPHSLSLLELQLRQ